jgi:uncharacterized membrane protein YGL010W
VFQEEKKKTGAGRAMKTTASTTQERKKSSSSAKARKRELSQRATPDQIAREMFASAGILERENEEKVIHEQIVNDAADYFHKHQNFANKWLHLLTMPVLIFTAQCYLQRYEIPVPVRMVEMAYDFAQKYGINQLLYIFAKPTMSHAACAFFYICYASTRDFFAATLWLVCWGIPSTLMSIACMYSWAPIMPQVIKYGWFGGWFLQVVVGHGVIEKRRPTLARGGLRHFIPVFINTSLYAPFYVWLEILFGVLLYWPELADAIDDRVDEMNAQEEKELRLRRRKKKA